MKLAGPMFEAPGNGMEKVISTDRTGAYCSVWHLDSNAGKVDPRVGMESLRLLFPDGEADDMNFVLFSTSGVHGSYTTIEDIEQGFQKYGEDFDPGEDWPEDWFGRELTVLVVHPRIVCLRCGNVLVQNAEDIAWLKRLRQSSFDAIVSIGVQENADEHA